MVYNYIPDQIKRIALHRVLVDGLTPEAAANSLPPGFIHHKTVARTVEKWEDWGSVNYPPDILGQRGRPAHISDEDMATLLELAEEKPSATLSELATALYIEVGVEVSPETVWKSLQRQGYTRKKLKSVAAEADPDKAFEFEWERLDEPTESFVFLDESAKDERTSLRHYGWSEKGHRSVEAQVFLRGTRYSMLPAVAYGVGMVHWQVIIGSYNHDQFYAFFETMLQDIRQNHPQIETIVEDNCPIHKGADMRELCADYGLNILHTPPYTPCFQPCENLFAIIKNKMRIDGNPVHPQGDGRALVELMEEQFNVDVVNRVIRSCGY